MGITESILQELKNISSLLSVIAEKLEGTVKSEGRLIPVTDWAKYHKWPPIGGLRHLIFNEKKNGLDKIIKRVGRRILIDEKAFLEWAKKMNKTIKVQDCQHS